MRPKTILIIVLIAVFAIGLIYWKNSLTILDKSNILDKRLASLFLKYKLEDTNLIRKYVEEKRKGLRRYVYVYREYNVPKTFSLNEFESAIRERIKNTKFRITKSDKIFTADFESRIYTISFGAFDILTLRLNKRREVPLPRIAKRYKNPKVAIVMDDFGYNMNNLDELFDIKKPVTLSILPNLRYSSEIAKIACSKGYEVILHLPLEPHRKDVPEEVDTINSRMNRKDIIARLDSAIGSVSGLRGASNHMGSKSTEEKELMAIILGNLKRKRLYFLDSLTSEKSVSEEVAKSIGLHYAERDIFLDNSNNVEYIRKQILELRRFAFKNGSAIAICHDRPNTIKVLSEMMPGLAAEGINFVYLSELVK